MRTVPYTRSVTSARSRGSRGSSSGACGAGGCARTRRPRSARAPRPRSRRDGVDERASGTSWASITDRSHHAAGRIMEGSMCTAPRSPARQALAVMRACLRAGPRRASSTPADSSERAVGDDLPGSSGSGRSSSFVGAPHLHPPPADPEPRARTRVAGPHDAGPDSTAGRYGSSRNSSTRELLGVRRLADLRFGHRCRGRVGRLGAQQLGARVDERVVELARGLVGSDRHADTREHRPGVETGFDLHEVDAGLRVAGEDRPLDRRRAAPARQQARSAGSRNRAAARRATRPEATARTPPRLRARAPLARTSSTTSRAFSGVSTRQAEVERGGLHR